MIRSALAPYGQSVDSLECDKVNKYIDLLLKWNLKISLTAVTNCSDIMRFHFGESIFALKYADIQCGRLADVGSGAGFPGLAIKIFRPELEIVLIESNHKKSAFLAEVVRTLDLDCVEIISKPFKESEIPLNSLQYVTCRALAEFPQLLHWSAQRLVREGVIILWVSSEKAGELQKIDPFTWRAPALIPNTKQRTILVGVKHT